MVKIRILKRQNRGYMELPGEMSAHEEVELFQLREGYYLLTVPLGNARPAASSRVAGRIDDAERALLKKLLAIRFENRTPAHVAKTLDNEEKTVLRELERKGFVNVFKGKKYSEGVYNINDSIYPLLSQREPASPRQPAAQPPQPTPGAYATLKSQGYLLIADRNEARQFSERLAQDMKGGAILGVKGFDGKFYAVTRNYFSKASQAILAALKDDMSVEAIASAAKLEADGCRAVLRIMAENGDVLEKRKGIFAAV